MSAAQVLRIEATLCVSTEEVRPAPDRPAGPAPDRDEEQVVFPEAVSLQRWLDLSA